MKMIAVLWLLIYSFVSSAASLKISPELSRGGDGGWVGMGGELIKDARNPWFVKNTAEVFYCIKIERRR